jgi:hypothetical protein
MKKLLLILLVLAVVACKKDKEEPIPFQVADYPIELVGEWKLVANKLYDYVIDDFRWSYFNEHAPTIIFDDSFSYLKIDSTGSQDGYVSEWHGTWKYTKQNICFMNCDYFYNIAFDTIRNFTQQETLYLLSLSNDTLRVWNNSYYQYGDDKSYGNTEQLYVRIN